MSKRIQKIISLVLVIVLLTNILPISSFAATDETEYDESQIYTVNDDVPEEEYEDPFLPEDAYGSILFEVEENRTEFSKDFLMESGAHMAVLYPEAVHFRTEDGEWEEIDNTLLTAQDGEDAVLTNANGIWDISFPGSTAEDAAIRIVKDGHTLSFRLEGALEAVTEAEDAAVSDSEDEPAEEALTDTEEIAEISEEENADISEDIAMEDTAENAEEVDTGESEEESAEEVAAEDVPALIMVEDESYQLQETAECLAEVVEVDLSEAYAVAEYEETVLENIASCVVYEDVLENTDVQYDLQSNRLKESLILDAYDAQLTGY